VRRPPALALVLAALLAVLAGCGETTEVREPDLVVREAPARSDQERPRQTPRGGEAVRIAVVTHGQASDPFWPIVRNGVEAAGRQMDALAIYRSPDVFSVGRMSRLIDEAVRSRPDGLVISIPDERLGPAIRRAVDAGIPVVSINSGADVYRRFGVLAHVGQPERRAGEEAGRRLVARGVRRAVCLNHERGNAGLERRCEGFAEALAEAGGRSRVVGLDFDDPRLERRLASTLQTGEIDGVLALNASGALAAVDAAGLADRADAVRIGTFDLSPEVLEALRAGRLEFAVDQQGYLQGYLPVVLLTQRVRYGLFPAEGRVVPTGPSFVTRDTAAQALRLSRRSIR
jgi:simple sugar transport system substrate-binding protein